MGRIKTKLVKRITREMVKRHGDQIATTFGDNKKVVAQRLDTQSKKLANMIAGYATRLKKKLVQTQ
jgi:small subunit ribosomal protein S17e